MENDGLDDEDPEPCGGEAGAGEGRVGGGCACACCWRRGGSGAGFVSNRRNLAVRSLESAGDIHSIISLVHTHALS